MRRKKQAKHRPKKGLLWLAVRFTAVSFTLLLLSAGLLLNSLLSNKQPCANEKSCADLSDKFEANKESVFMGRKVTAPAVIAGNFDMRVLGATTGEKHIFVDLSTQQLHAYQGDKLILSFPVSSGKWHPTPTGDFRIWVKIRNAHMEGGEGADYYNLYNVPYTMFFYSDKVPKSLGFSLHGAYWHNNFGHPMSHGCVNIRPEDAAKLYEWASPQTQGSTTYASSDDPGTLITISGTPPDY